MSLDGSHTTDYKDAWLVCNYMVRSLPVMYHHVESLLLHTNLYIYHHTNGTSLPGSHTALCTLIWGQYVITWFTHCSLYIDMWTVRHHLVHTLLFVHWDVDSTSLPGSHTALCTLICGQYVITWFTHCSLYIDMWTIHHYLVDTLPIDHQYVESTPFHGSHTSLWALICWQYVVTWSTHSPLYINM